MLYIKKKIYMTLFKGVFCLGVIAMAWIFMHRTLTGSEVTAMSDGQIMKLSEQYTMGTVSARNGEPLVWGEDNQVIWNDPDTESAFSEIIGVDIKKSTNSKMTVSGKCGWIFGSEDDGFSREKLFHPLEERIGGNVQITLDKNLQIFINKLLEKEGYEQSGVFISNWKTGEILAAEGPVFSKTYHPGSTIKPIETAAVLSLNPDLESYVYTCVDANHNYRTAEGTYRINCINNKSHGVICQEDALTYSCNGYFVSLLQQVPKENMLNELKKWGFDSVKSYQQFMYWDHSFVDESEKEIDYLLAGIGQGNCYISIAGLNFCTNALLNGGILKEPVLLAKKQSMPDSEWVDIMVDKTYEMCSQQVAEHVVNMMIKVNEKGTGKSFYMPGFACKTGTAQKADVNGGISDKYTVWTTGGLVAEETPYSITVCLDNVPEEVGSIYAGKIAKEILEYMVGGMRDV